MRGCVKEKNRLDDQDGLTMKTMASLVHGLPGEAATRVTIAGTMCRITPGSTSQTSQLRL